VNGTGVVIELQGNNNSCGIIAYLEIPRLRCQCWCWVGHFGFGSSHGCWM